MCRSPPCVVAVAWQRHFPLKKNAKRMGHCVGVSKHPKPKTNIEQTTNNLKNPPDLHPQKKNIFDPGRIEFRVWEDLGLEF